MAHGGPLPSEGRLPPWVVSRARAKAGGATRAGGWVSEDPWVLSTPWMRNDYTRGGWVTDDPAKTREKWGMWGALCVITSGDTGEARAWGVLLVGQG